MNANITKIEIVQSTETMGEITDEQAAEWTDYLESKLTDEFVNAEINVKLDTRTDSNTLYAESACDGEGCPIDTDAKNTVREFINFLWDSWR